MCTIGKDEVETKPKYLPFAYYLFLQQGRQDICDVAEEKKRKRNKRKKISHLLTSTSFITLKEEMLFVETLSKQKKKK